MLTYFVNYLLSDPSGLIPGLEVREVCPLVPQLEQVDHDVCLGPTADMGVGGEQHTQQSRP